MTKAEIYKKVLREYEKEKFVSDELYKKKVDEIYTLIPDIKKVDEEIMRVNIEFARNSLKSGGKKDISELKEKNKELLRDRKSVV